MVTLPQTFPTSCHRWTATFKVLDLSEDNVEMLNNEDDLITSASLVSVDDLRKQRKKLKVWISAEADEFMIMLKRYVNLVYVVFSETWPMFKLLREVIFALRCIYRQAQKRVTMATRGSILWIILLQSRQFALGEVSILCEFTTMHSDLRAKRATIHHS